MCAPLLACLLAGCSTQYADPVRAVADSGTDTNPCAQWTSEIDCARDTANGCSVQPNEVGCHLGAAQCAPWTCASGDPFVRRSGATLFLGARPFRFVGANAWGVAGTSGTCQYGGFSSQEEVLTQTFGDLADMRVQVLRVWAFQSYCGDSGTDYSALDQVVRYARAAGVRLVFVLENMWDDCSRGKRDDSWFTNGYRSPYGGYALSFPDFTRGLVAHFRDEPTILAWEVMHEASGNDAAAMLDFSTQMTALVRSTDSNHLIVLGSDNGDSPGTQLAGSSSPYTKLQGLDTVDLVDTHDFFTTDATVTAREQAVCAVAQSLRKPCFIGASAVSLADSSAQEFSVRESRVAGKAQAALDGGFAGYLLYAYTPGWQSASFDFDGRSSEPLAGPSGTLARLAARLRTR
jgi:mannan endo-1,4-beta-mannosidase